MKYDFAISYEIINREYEAVTLLKKELERRGYKVLIFQATALTKRIRTKVVVLHSFYNDDNFPFVYYVFGKNQKILNLHWEEIYHKSTMNADDNKFLPHGNALNVSHVAWGQREHDDLIRAGVKEEKIALVGYLSLDLITKDIFIPRKTLSQKYGLNPNKRWILFISSLAVWKDDYIFKPDHPLYMPGHKDYSNLASDTRAILLNWFTRILCTRNDIEIIYRPHPEEISGRCEPPSGGWPQCDGFHVIADEVVAQWIYSCDLVYNWDSTSLIQQYLLKKGTTRLVPLPIEDEYEMFTNCPKVSTYDEFIKDIDSEHDIIRDELLESYYLIDDKYAYKKLADYLEKLYYAPPNFDGIDYNAVLKNRAKMVHFRNRLFRNMFVNISKICNAYTFFSPLKRLFRMGYRPTEKINVISDIRRKEIDNKIERFLSEDTSCLPVIGRS